MPRSRPNLIPDPKLPTRGGYQTACIREDRRQGVRHFAAFDAAGRQVGYIRQGPVCWVSWRELAAGGYRELTAPVLDTFDGLRTLAKVMEISPAARAWFAYAHAGAEPSPWGRQHAMAV